MEKNNFAQAFAGFCFLGRYASKKVCTVLQRFKACASCGYSASSWVHQAFFIRDQTQFIKFSGQVFKITVISSALHLFISAVGT